MGLFSFIGDALGAIGVPFASDIGDALDGSDVSSAAGGIASYAGQQATNSANAAIHASDNAFNADQAVINRSWSADQAQKQMDYQTQMANTGWQRGVKDMQAAGLSPMLAYMKGPNPSPSGSMGSSSAASAASPIAMGNAAAAGVTGANSAADTANKLATKDLIEAQTSNTGASQGLTEAQTAQTEALTRKINAEIPKIQGDTNFEVQQDILRKTAYLIYNQGFQASEQAVSTGAQRQLIQPQINQIVANTTLANFDIKAAQDANNLGREAGQLKPIIDMLFTAIRLGKGR